MMLTYTDEDRTQVAVCPTIHDGVQRLRTTNHMDALRPHACYVPFSVDPT